MTVPVIQYRITEKFGKLTLFKNLAKKVWRINRSANEFLIVSTNLDGFIWRIVVIWRIMDNLPNSLNFSPAKLSAI